MMVCRSVQRDLSVYINDLQGVGKRGDDPSLFLVTGKRILTGIKQINPALNLDFESVLY